MKSRVTENNNQASNSCKIPVDVARRWLRNHVQKGEQFGTSKACEKLGIETPKELYSYVLNKLYPKDGTGKQMVEYLKKNDSNLTMHTGEKVYKPSALQEKSTSLTKDIENLEKKKSNLLNQYNSLALKIEADKEENKKLEIELQKLERMAKTINDRLTLELEHIGNVQDNIQSVEAAIVQRQTELSENAKLIEEAKAWHVSLIKFEGIEMYNKKMPDLLEKFGVLMELMEKASKMEDQFAKDLFNSSSQEDTLLAAEYVYCYRKACESTERKVYMHIGEGSVYDLLSVLPAGIINIVFESLDK